MPVPRTLSKTFRSEICPECATSPSARELAGVPELSDLGGEGHIVVDDVPLQKHGVVKRVPMEYTRAHEDVISGEGSGASSSTSKFPSFFAPYNNRRIAVDASFGVLSQDEPLSHLYKGSSKGKGSSKNQGSSNDEKTSKDTVNAGVQEEPSYGRSLQGPWDVKSESFEVMGTPWDLEVPDNVPGPIAKAIEMCLAPDGPPQWGVQAELESQWDPHLMETLYRNGHREDRKVVIYGESGASGG